jgi:hypothetical protein
MSTSFHRDRKMNIAKAVLFFDAIARVSLQAHVGSVAAIAGRISAGG